MIPYYESENVKLYNADCLEVMPQLERVNGVITSPPYPGVNNMWGDLFKAENFLLAHEFLNQVWGLCNDRLLDGCKLMINIANTKRRPYLPNTSKIYQWAENKIEPLGEYIWNKGYGQLGTAWGSFRSPSDISMADQHEYILVFRKYGKRNRPEAFEKISVKQFKSWRNSIWNIAPESATAIGHCAPYPLQIPTRLAILYTFKQEVILDPFCGSGTTLVAAIQTGRKAVGIEISQQYCDIAVKRIKDAEQQMRLF